MNPKGLCCVAMPGGLKTDLGGGWEVDFDQIYTTAVKPAISESGLEPLRADEEHAGGIIHAGLFARLLLAEFAVVDLSSGDPNVFYELGVRQAANPATTVPIFANTHLLPFDAAMMRAIGYRLEAGRLTEEGANELRAAIKFRLDEAIRGTATEENPLLQLIPDFPRIDIPHEVTDAFKESVRHEESFRNQLAEAQTKASDEEKRRALLEIQDGLGDLKTVQRNVLVDLILAYRDLSAWQEMAALCESSPDYVQDLTMVKQQWALALNRRNEPGDRDKALRLLEEIMTKQRPDPETLGILGRIHKDRYKEAQENGSIQAAGALDNAIAAYTRGFESDPRDYYPGINAITLLVEKGDADALKEAERLVPLVSIAVARRGGASSADYWDLVTVLELACVGGDWPMAMRVLPKALAAANASWMSQTTLTTLRMIKSVRERHGQTVPDLDVIIRRFESRTSELQGG